MGFAVNSGVILAVVGRGDYIICDDRDHASIVDGRRLSFATSLHYKHNDMDDLERVLMKLPHDAVKLIVVDGVFSMEGDLAKLPEIVELKKKYNCSLMVDEAHGLGVFGKEGRGVCDHFGVTDDVDLIMGTFSKSLASVGGFIAATRIPSTISVITAAPTSSRPATLLLLRQQPWRLCISSVPSRSVSSICGTLPSML